MLAGPILRHTTSDELNLWCVLSKNSEFTVQVEDDGQQQLSQVQNNHIFQVGKNAWIVLTRVTLIQPSEVQSPLSYDLTFKSPDCQSRWLNEKQDILYSGATHFSFYTPNKLTMVAHGSCRKPHYPGGDALVRIDESIASELQGGSRRPDLLLMTGDQVYCDDVAGPMLVAIHQVVEKLGLFSEEFADACISNSQQLWSHPYNLYRREHLLPCNEDNKALNKAFFGGKKKPIFTSANARNHLVSFAEMIAMYLLVWSPSLWAGIDLTMPNQVPQEFRPTYAKEYLQIEAFSAALSQVRRAMAHIPVYMIFDDHDVTDDWNLNRAWEVQAYQHPFSRRIVGNALFAYFLCQGFGNQPAVFEKLCSLAHKSLNKHGISEQDQMIDALFAHSHWHYRLFTSPLIYVMDTRTRRWRSEKNAHRPSGLLDWEALCDFQQEIMGHKQVIVVSAAPIFGVKLIEVIQKIFTLMGKALMVDAENWMAHKGTAKVLLNILCHSRTADAFIILSGDVHYSFAYDMSLRFRQHGPDILQFTASGIKNAFPDKLLQPLATLNHWLYGPSSWINIFTRRRGLRITRRRYNHSKAHGLLNKPAIGILYLAENTEMSACKALCADGETVEFTRQPNHIEKKESCNV